MNLNTAHGELLLAILAATAAFERRLILTRSRRPGECQAEGNQVWQARRGVEGTEGSDRRAIAQGT